jgi:hypothetical protein
MFCGFRGFCVNRRAVVPTADLTTFAKATVVLRSFSEGGRSTLFCAGCGAFLFGNECLRDDADVRFKPVAAAHAAIGKCD